MNRRSKTVWLKAIAVTCAVFVGACGTVQREEGNTMGKAKPKQTVSAKRAGAAKDWRQDDFTWIRGLDYTPSYAPNDVMTWRDFDAAVVERELGYAEKMGINSVRTWLQYIVFEHYPERFAANFETFLSLCDKHGIRAMPILFDSCFGQEPTIDWNGHWVMSPGTSKEVPEYWPKLQKYVDEVVGKHVGDRRVVIWDIMNEPAATPLTINFVKHWCEVIRKMDPTHPVTVGVAGGTTMVMPYVDDEDVLSMHSYSSPAVVLKYQINMMKRLGKEKGKPVIITECCAPAWGQPYEMALPVLRETGIGWYAWELIIGKNQFNAVSGLLYPDGTCRRATAVAAVMNTTPDRVPFKEKPDSEGIPVKLPPPTKVPVNAELMEQIRAVAATPTTADNLEYRKNHILPHLIALGQLVTLSPQELQEAVGPILRSRDPEWNKDIARACKDVDRVLAIFAGHLDEIDLDQLEE